MAKTDHWRDLQESDVLSRFSEAPRFKPKELKPKTRGQAEYLKSIIDHSLTFCSGPAGSGKSFLSCGYAAKLYLDGKISKIVLTRPMVECGRRLGAMPGELDEKIDPYMGPLFECLGEFIDPKEIYRMKKSGIIVSSPIELMRGKTFSDCFVILDEAQNIDQDQMLMFLTRIGENTKMVINGDLRQIDLRYPEDSGLDYAMRVLDDDEIGRVYLTTDDVVRSGIVKKILKLWDDDPPIASGY